MHITASTVSTGGQFRPSIRCPSCKKVGVFDVMPNIPDLLVQRPTMFHVGIKRCPNEACHSVVFAILDAAAALVQTYPAERVDFDTSNVPAHIAGALDEAVTCHANGSFTACAIMVRRTLELLCEDRGATGSDLHKRIESLRSKVVLPNELFVAMHELRILGNDAAHVEAKVYADITKNETEVAIELTKEILKATFQLEGLVKRLQALKRP
jgi:hypothetical protein